MPVFRLGEDLAFPRPELAEEDGLLAVGGDLSEERLMLAYSLGIFPWYSEGSPILWWSPDPRLVLFPEDLKVSRSLRQTLGKGIYSVTFDRAFDRVIRACAETRRRGEQGTWITREMREAYCCLHARGIAHSVESWFHDELVGGLYGVALGGVFFGESMFTVRSDASKVALSVLVDHLKLWGYRMVDCQVRTDHLISLGAREIRRSEFMRKLRIAVTQRVSPQSWTG